MNLALQQCLEARGLDEAADTFKAKEAMAANAGNKVDQLILANALKVTLVIRDELAKRAYNNLKLYFDGDGEWAIAEANKPLNESAPSST